MQDPVEAFLGRPLPRPAYTDTSVPQTLEGVDQLTASGRWRAACTLCERLRSSSWTPEAGLRLRHVHIVCLLRVREVEKAEREIAQLGDLRSTRWAHSAIEVPHALHLLHAMLPAYSGKHDEALTRLYALLAAGSSSARPSSAAAAAAAPLPAQAIEQSASVMLAIVNVLCALGDLPNAIAHLEQLTAALLDGDKSGLGGGEGGAGRAAGLSLETSLSLLGRVHLQLGNLHAAAEAFERLESHVADPLTCVAVRLNRGMLETARSEYERALHEFEAVRSMEPTNALAANNTAVCQLYCCRLADAVETLEGLLKADPHGSMHQVIISNLEALYQMREGRAASKVTLERLVLATAADDFDMSALQLGQS